MWPVSLSTTLAGTMSGVGKPFTISRSKDHNGNASRTPLIAEESKGNYVDASKLVALVGVQNLVVVDMPDALLIASRGKAQDVANVVKALERQQHEELL